MRICKGWKTKVHWATAINWTAIKYIELESCYAIATIRYTINKICQWQPHQESKGDTFGQHKGFSTIIKIRIRKRSSNTCSWIASPQQNCNWFCKPKPPKNNSFTWKPTKEIRSCHILSCHALSCHVLSCILHCLILSSCIAAPSCTTLLPYDALPAHIVESKSNISDTSPGTEFRAYAPTILFDVF